MKFIVNGNEQNINKIRFRHKSTDYSYQRVIPDIRFDPYFPDISFIFDDTQEVDFLIGMLTQFQQQLRDNIGYWKKEN